MEQPNLLYIDDLAGNDSMFKQKLIQVIKEELLSFGKASEQ